MALGSRSIEHVPAAGRSEIWPRIGARSALFWIVPFGVAAVYLVVLLVQFRHNLWVVYWNADYTSGFTIPTTLARTGTGGHALLGTSGSWVPLWFGLLTASLPLHRVLWELAPTGVFVFTALTVGWSVAQVASRRAAALAVLLILAVSPRALYFFIAPVAHNVVWPGTALLGAYLVWLVDIERRRRRVTWTVAVLGGVVLGTFIASDALLIATGLVPFAITALLIGVRRQRRSRLMAASALTTAFVAVPVAKLISIIMTSLGYVTVAPSVTTLAPLSSLPRHAELMWEGIRATLNGYLDQITPHGPGTALGVVCEIITIAALAALLFIGVRTTVQFVRSNIVRGDATPRASLARSVHVIYWAGSAAATVVAWALSIRIEYVHESYYATLVFSLAAVVVLVTGSRSRARWLVSAGASIFFLASIVGLVNGYIVSYETPIEHSTPPTGYVPVTARYETQIVNFAKGVGVVNGYAGYRDASTITWHSRERVLIRPVQLCEGVQGVSICPSSTSGCRRGMCPSDNRRSCSSTPTKASYPRCRRVSASRSP